MYKRQLYTHNGLLYFHTQVKNTSNVPYEVEIEQPVMGIESAQQVLDAERLAPDMLDKMCIRDRIMPRTRSASRNAIQTEASAL